jgi:chromosome segregation ATPase
MGMSDTPETDLFYLAMRMPPGRDSVRFARKLERERNDARRELEEMIDHSSMLQKARDAFDRKCEAFERERDTMREENRKLRELCAELFEAIDEHADYRVQPGGGYTKERILIEKTDQLLNP